MEGQVARHCKVSQYVFLINCKHAHILSLSKLKPKEFVVQLHWGTDWLGSDMFLKKKKKKRRKQHPDWDAKATIFISLAFGVNISKITVILSLRSLCLCGFSPPPQLSPLGQSRWERIRAGGVLCFTDTNTQWRGNPGEKCGVAGVAQPADSSTGVEGVESLELHGVKMVSKKYSLSCFLFPRLWLWLPWPCYDAK